MAPSVAHICQPPSQLSDRTHWSHDNTFLVNLQTIGSLDGLTYSGVFLLDGLSVYGIVFQWALGRHPSVSSLSLIDGLSTEGKK